MMSSTEAGGFFVCLLVAAVVDFFSAAASEGVEKLAVLATDGVTGDDATGDGVKLVFGRILALVVVFVGATETVESPPTGSGWRFVVVVVVVAAPVDDDDDDDALDGAAEDNVAADGAPLLCTAEWGRLEGFALLLVTAEVGESGFVLARPSSCAWPSFCWCWALTNSLNKLFSPYRATRSAIWISSIFWLSVRFFVSVPLNKCKLDNSNLRLSTTWPESAEEEEEESPPS